MADRGKWALSREDVGGDTTPGTAGVASVLRSVVPGLGWSIPTDGLDASGDADRNGVGIITDDDAGGGGTCCPTAPYEGTRGATEALSGAPDLEGSDPTINLDVSGDADLDGISIVTDDDGDDGREDGTCC